MSAATGLTAPMTFPKPPAALVALVASPFGGWLTLFVIFVLLELASGYARVDGDFLRSNALSAGVWALPLAIPILVVGLFLVLIGLYVDYVNQRSALKLWWCLLAGTLFGLFHVWIFGAAYYDPDDFIGERDPGLFGYLLEPWWLVPVMTLPGIASGGTFWLVARLFARRRAID